MMKILLSFLLACVLTLGVSAHIVSPALDIIAKDVGIVKTSLVSRDIFFDKSDFTQTIGTEKLEKITLVSIPDISVGKLMLGDKELSVNASVSSRNLDKLRFVPTNSQEIETSFEFTSSDGDGAVYTCKLYLLNSENTAPSVKSENGAPIDVTTYSGISLYGTMPASDKEGDLLVFMFESSPENGEIALTNSELGHFVYKPRDGFVGTDVFSYSVTDKYGNKSEVAEVNINVKEPESNIVFNDLTEHWAHCSAIEVCERGIMDFEVSADGYNFYPNEPVTRAEFCAALMKSAGFDGFTSVGATPFNDDASIPEEYKGMIVVANILGVVSGTPNGDGIDFCPNNMITRAEAAVMINRLYRYESDGAIEVFADADTVPAWAKSSLDALAGAGIIKGSTDGNISAYACIDRAQSAVMLSSIMNG